MNLGAEKKLKGKGFFIRTLMATSMLAPGLAISFF
jgi:hypothetical protein